MGRTELITHLGFKGKDHFREEHMLLYIIWKAVALSFACSLKKGPLGSVFLILTTFTGFRNKHWRLCWS